ncbi:hypothetical protein CDSE_0216 [Candidatus Kinetoplastibacterium desouzaii TCC079E]|uniref:Uncharacterized protein n=1 Tax=Candidatus Kinetoplastidibacterium desouzai TCC079E TaxID=1208919 RepID=M1LLD3_9PROT|nr:hypothetical protein [Candidatus Kinetoplastibacterium desouzaii]AGF46572.1 hypothetical protein CDSE_0216 [Candidatus Kinetoplastibacterium desouzaii TCC079E]
MLIVKKLLINFLITIISALIIGNIMAYNISTDINKNSFHETQSTILSANGKKFIAQPPQPLTDGTLGDPNLKTSPIKKIDTVSLIEKKDYENNTINIKNSDNNKIILNNKISSKIPTIDLLK